MNWFKKLFGKEKRNAHLQPDEAWPRTEVVYAKVAPKDISEPVLAIVECMKKYPSQFKFKYDADTEHCRSCQVTDVKTKEVFKGARYGYNILLDSRAFRENIRSFYYIRERPWLTEDEEFLLIQTLQEIQEVKRKRKESIKMVGYNKDRKRLQEMYK